MIRFKSVMHPYELLDRNGNFDSCTNYVKLLDIIFKLKLDNIKKIDKKDD